MNNRTNDDMMCDLCGRHNDLNHKHSELHRFHHMLFGFNECRKIKYPNNKVSIAVNVELANKNGIREEMKEQDTLHVKLSPNRFDDLRRTLRFKFTITNGGANPVHVIFNKLHPHRAFELECDRNICALNTGESYSPVIRFKVDEIMIGSVKIPIGIVIQPQDINQAKNYVILYREIVLIIKEGDDREENNKKSPFKKEKWTNVKNVPPNKATRFLNNFPTPNNLSRIMYTGLNVVEKLSYTERNEILKIKNIFNQGPNRENYSDFFHYLLWLDEAGATIGISQYNMTEVTVKLIRSAFLELEVPGLAEKRPSVMVGDLINIRPHSDQTAYQGVVDSVNDKTIFIKDINEILLRTLRDVPGLELDVSFQLSRLQYERMHTGVDMCVRNHMLNSLFPKAPLREKVPAALHPATLFNPSIGLNQEQLTAVQNIISETSQEAPYIIFGPPGTGKTVTIVEAILQIKKRTKKHILICAPANAACDMLASKLLPHCEKKELLRLHTSTRSLSEIPPDIKRISNLEGDDFVEYKGGLLKKDFRIVIATLHFIGKFSDTYNPDCVFIDEAAQATEPESDIPIGLLCPGKQIVLAGDPKQLGPVNSSTAAETNGLATSLLERLMNTNQLYASTSDTTLTYNPLYLTMLINNYRSPREIIEIPNQLFYGNALQCAGNHADPISNIYISKRINGQGKQFNGSAAVEFCGMLSKEERKGYSPSYFNEAEIEMVMKYINTLMNLPDIRVAAKDIGIIAPYIRQVHRIKEEIKRCNFTDIEVGTTESFQGREKRIMIISTVRAQHSLLKYDKKYRLGFVRNPRRFNVAVTRAISKLIIIGNPFVLCYDRENWCKYIEYCQDKNAYFGIPFEERTSTVRHQIMSLLRSWNCDL